MSAGRHSDLASGAFIADRAAVSATPDRGFQASAVEGARTKRDCRHRGTANDTLSFFHLSTPCPSQSHVPVTKMEHVTHCAMDVTGGMGWIRALSAAPQSNFVCVCVIGILPLVPSITSQSGPGFLIREFSVQNRCRTVLHKIAHPFREPSPHPCSGLVREVREPSPGGSVPNRPSGSGPRHGPRAPASRDNSRNRISVLQKNSSGIQNSD